MFELPRVFHEPTQAESSPQYTHTVPLLEAMIAKAIVVKRMVQQRNVMEVMVHEAPSLERPMDTVGLYSPGAGTPVAVPEPFSP